MFFWLICVTDAIQVNESRKYFTRGPHFGQPWRRPQSLSDSWITRTSCCFLFPTDSSFEAFRSNFIKNFPLALFVHHVQTEDGIVVITGCYFTAWRFLCSINKSNPITGLDRPLGLQEVEAPRLLDNRHMKVVRLSALRTGRLYPLGKIPGTHFC